MSVHEKLKRLRQKMAEHDLQAYLVPRADEFQGEFVAPYAERLKWLTGFTGSGGMAIIFADESRKSLVLTDARYTLQVKQQVDMDVFDVGDYIKKPPTDWLIENLKSGGVVGFDPFLHSVSAVESIEKKCSKKSIAARSLSVNLIDNIWDDQPERPSGKAGIFPEHVAGRTVAEKTLYIASKIEDNAADACFVALPDSIAWLLNVRGDDIKYIPSVLSYALVDAKGAITWFVDPSKTDGLDMEAMSVSICVKDIADISENLKECLKEGGIQSVMCDPSNTPYAIKEVLEQSGVDIVSEKDPCIHPKSIKSDSEIAAIKKAHVQDAVALIRFIKWLEENVSAVTLTELDAESELQKFRQKSKFYQGDSFPTISGFGSNAAIVHYRATEKTNAKMAGGGFLLLDSGAQYSSLGCNDDQDKNAAVFGTTDITRTIPIGVVSDEMRENYTRVVKGHIALAKARFPKGSVGAQIDTFARSSLWEVGLDFAHGTGHGVGCYLAVHEEAANISPRGQTQFEAGMLISNEPGYYKEGEYGIRVENLVLVVEDKQYENMLAFETVSCVPIETSVLVTGLLSSEEQEWINAYHDYVFKTVSPLLNDLEKEWLQHKTKAI